MTRVTGLVQVLCHGSSDNGGSNFLEKALYQWALLTKAFPSALRFFPRAMKVVIAATVFSLTVPRAASVEGMRYGRKGSGSRREKTDYCLFLHFLNPPSAQQRSS